METQTFVTLAPLFIFAIGFVLYKIGQYAMFVIHRWYVNLMDEQEIHMKTIIILMCLTGVLGYVIGSFYNKKPLQQYCVEFHAPYAARIPGDMPWNDKSVWVTDTCKRFEWK